MKIDIAVITVPNRHPMAQELVERTGARVLSQDTDRRGPTWNCREAFKQLDPASDWVLCLDDDSVVGDRFPEQLHRCLSAAQQKGFEAVNLFTCGYYDMRKALEAEKRGANWFLNPSHPGLAKCFRGYLLPHWLETAAEWPDSGPPDNLTFQWIKRQQLRHAFALPSLIDHRDDIPSETAVWRPKVDGRQNPFFEPNYEGDWDGSVEDILPARLEVRVGGGLECKIY